MPALASTILALARTNKMNVGAAIKKLGFFYLCFGLGFIAGCAFIGFLAGAGLIQFQ